jgi:hypothetical protein
LVRVEPPDEIVEHRKSLCLSAPFYLPSEQGEEHSKVLPSVSLLKMLRRFQHGCSHRSRVQHADKMRCALRQFDLVLPCAPSFIGGLPASAQVHGVVAAMAFPWPVHSR